ncbi:MAG: hypothetical protein CVU05_06185 [Bacteroidetes bacterium HGW-Bacteroidetes-21]|jgi:O-antigen/teichoic acid export membrane protein|nr:MAG: hypothetical protein CVU05_06185 [Bacteroidetes bacterium HGW-Bacteroidetes-21]
MNINKTIIVTFLSQVSIQVLGIISGIFIARFIGPEGKGIFAIYQANAQIFITFFSFSLGSALTYFIPSKIIKPEKLLGISLLVILFGSILSTIIVFLFYYSQFSIYLFPSKYSSFLFILWMFAFSSLSILNVIATGFFQGMKLFNKLNIISVTNSIINVVFFTLLFFLSREGIIGKNVLNLLYCLLAITLINSLQYGFSFYRSIKIIPDFKISYKLDLRPIFSFALYTHISTFISFFNYRFSIWVLNYYLNEVAIGLFSLASNISILFSFVSQTIGNILMPVLSGESEEIKRKMFYKYSRINSTLLIVLSFISFFVCIPLFPLLYGKDYTDAIVLFQLFLPGIFFLGFSRMFAVYIASKNEQKYNLYATIIGFVVNAISSILLIKYYGTKGASISGTITYLFTCLAMMYFSHVNLKLPIVNYFFMTNLEIKNNFNALKKLIFRTK